MPVTRTQELWLTPSELAELFCSMSCEQQAAFFEQVYGIASGWPGSAWEYQAGAIAKRTTPAGRQIIRALALEINRTGDSK